MCRILASVLNRPLERLVSDEGPALGAAVVTLAGLESYLRNQRGIADAYTAADAVASMRCEAAGVTTKPPSCVRIPFREADADER